MTEWKRAPSPTLCGYCGTLLDADAPILITTLATVKRARIRGQCCAGPAPPIVGYVKREKIPPPMQSLQSVPRPKTRGDLKTLAREWMPFRDAE